MMKWICLVILMAVIGCTQAKEVEVLTAEQAARKAEIEESPWSDIQHFEYNGHQYIRFYKARGHATNSAASHDPDCLCHKKER
jgi:hypothetical protein